MGMIGYGIAAAIGYYAGQPEGRRQLTTLRRQAAELVRSPEARRLREHGWDLVGDGALATRSLAAKVRPRSNARDGDENVDATRRGPVLRGRSAGLASTRLRLPIPSPGPLQPARTGQPGSAPPHPPKSLSPQPPGYLLRRLPEAHGHPFHPRTERKRDQIPEILCWHPRHRRWQSTS
jgi:hypothetical protein